MTQLDPLDSLPLFPTFMDGSGTTSGACYQFLGLAFQWLAGPMSQV